MQSKLERELSQNQNTHEWKNNLCPHMNKDAYMLKWLKS